jgi:nitrite reductase (NADH) large subunit
VVNDPLRRKWFKQFVNTDETEPCIEFVRERGQRRPADWPGELVSLEQIKLLDGRTLGEVPAVREMHWVQVGTVADFPREGGAAIKYGKVQIAVFNFTSRGTWYACQNMCPHKKAFVLSRGIIGDAAGVPKVACPLHKKTFSLQDGRSLSGDDYHIRTFPVKIDADAVYLELPPEGELDRILATEIGCNLATSCSAAPQLLPA